MKPLVFDRGALSDLNDAASYYETQTVEAGERLQAKVDRAFQKLRANPQHYPRIGRTAYRKCPVPPFRYLIFFLERPDYIWIAAVAHSSRRPGYWRKRKPLG